MEQYTVTGMSCAACSSRVEKAVSKVAGVTACSVSLLTNSMGVEGTAAADAIIAAVEDAGYGASPKSSSKSQSDTAVDREDFLEDKETPVLKKRLAASLCLLIPLMYFSMGHMMWNWPVPSISVSYTHLVHKFLEALSEVESANVSHESGTAVVTLNAEIADSTLQKAVEDQDYKVLSIQ